MTKQTITVVSSRRWSVTAGHFAVVTDKQATGSAYGGTEKLAVARAKQAHSRNASR